MKTVLFALAQVVVIVSGILAAGLVYQFFQMEAGGIGFLIHRGYWILAIPLLWTMVISLLRHRTGLVEQVAQWELISGFLLTGCLALVFMWITVRPWLTATWAFGLQDSGE